MCGIAGAVIPKGSAVDFTNIINILQKRGRDSVGVAHFYASGMDEHKYTSDKMFKNATLGAGVFMCNRRAEPTTERVMEKCDDDVQPMQYGERIYAVHNGTIANDKELKEKYGLKLYTSIDSAVIPGIVHEKMEGGLDFVRACNEMVTELVGSYALVIVDKENPSEMFVACNYKPLYFAEKDGAFIYASTLEAFNGMDVVATPIAQYQSFFVRECADGDVRIFGGRSLYDHVPKRALVVASGGLDSTVAAKEMMDDGYDVTLLHFQYSCRAEGKEVKAVKDIAEWLGCEALFVKTSIFKDVIQGSRLTGTKDEDTADGVEGAEYAHEWVPARNLIMLSLATGIAESKGFSYLVLGNNLEESGAYPDNEPEFINRFNHLLPYATADGKHVRIMTPVGNLMKHEIVNMGLANGAPMQLTWSCYDHGKKHCGNCGPCFMRKTAFEMNGADEVIEYESDKK